MTIPVASKHDVRRAETARALVAEHFPHGDAPAGLHADLVRALARAELRGYADCKALLGRVAA